MRCDPLLRSLPWWCAWPSTCTACAGSDLTRTGGTTGWPGRTEMATPAAVAVTVATPVKIAARTGMAVAYHPAAAATTGTIAAVEDASQPLRRAAVTAATAARRACAALRVSATRTARPPAALRVSRYRPSGRCRRLRCRRWAGRCRRTGSAAWICLANRTAGRLARGIAAAARSPAGMGARSILVTCPAGWGKDAAAAMDGIHCLGSPAGPVIATTLLAPTSTTTGRPPGLGADAAAITEGGTSETTPGSAEPRWTPAARAMASNAVSVSLRSCRSCSAFAARCSSTSLCRNLRRRIDAYPFTGELRD
jgi:hypothetical protein